MKISNNSYPKIFDEILPCLVLFFLSAFIYGLYCYFNSLENLFVSCIIFVISLLLLIMGFVYQQTLKMDFNDRDNLKYVDFLYDSIYFAYTNQANDERCCYDDIQEVKIVFHIEENSVGSRAYSYQNRYRLKNYELRFILKDKREIILFPQNVFSMKLMYKIIDYLAKCQKISYSYTPEGNLYEITRKLDNYINYGNKQLHTSMQNFILKFTSIALFSLTFLLFIIVYPQIPDYTKYYFQICMWIVFLPIGISFIIDVVLIADNILEQSSLFKNPAAYKEYNENKTFIISFVLIKIVLLSIMIYSITKYFP